MNITEREIIDELIHRRKREDESTSLGRINTPDFWHMKHAFERIRNVKIDRNFYNKTARLQDVWMFIHNYLKDKNIGDLKYDE